MRAAMLATVQATVRRVVCAAILLGALTSPREAAAECGGNASSCVSCHESRGEHPVLTSPAPWHRDHSFGDLCASCHAGAPEALDAAAAHVGLRDPLADPTTTCGECHDDASRRAPHYLDARTRDHAPEARTGGATTTPRATAPRTGAPTIDHVLGLVASILFVAITLALRHRAWPPRTSIRAALGAAQWSPYLAGIGLGLTVAVSMIYCGRILAVSGAFDKLAAYLGAALFPAHPYWRHVMSPAINWQVWLVVGLLLGAFASAWVAGGFRWRALPDTLWRERFGGSTRTRLVVAFVGACLVQIGAGIAGGCTSGMAISGGAVMSPAAYVFMAAMFAAGIPTAWLVVRLARRRAGGQAPR
jgi:uncharacterized membrane protein YedE/YeeE